MALRLRACTLLLTLAVIATGTQTACSANSAMPTQQALATLARNEAGLEPSAQLLQLFDLIWQWQLDNYPELATYNGIAGHSDTWTDLSPAAMSYRRDMPVRFLTILETIDPAGLPPERRLDYRLVQKSLQAEIERNHYTRMLSGQSPSVAPPWPINAMSGIQLTIPQVIAIMPANTVADYDHIVARLQAAAPLLEQTTKLLKRSLAKGMTAPQVTLKGMPAQIDSLMPVPVTDSPLYARFTAMPETIPAAEQTRLRQAAKLALTEQTYPAFRQLRDYLVSIYIPRARTSIGLSALRNGDDWYAALAREYTTTDLTPSEIHELGLSEVARIRQAMAAIKNQTGFSGSLADFFIFLRSDPQFFFDDPQQLLMTYRDIAKRIDPQLTTLFATLPRLPYGVKEVPAYAAPATTTAYYEPGSVVAGRPGYFFANTYDLNSRPKWEMEALTLHEAVPGHHLQIALMQEQAGIHPLIKDLYYTAFVEGWGLYAESLGGEIGLYRDPYAKFGQLTYEMWRSIRLVVDTGMHSLGWSRQQAIDYFKQNSGKAEHDIEVEIDRYITMPGQALAYKVGELKIKALRAKAETALGDKFDIRAFHDLVLARGALPLDLLEARVDAWIAAQTEQP
ncbi:DUF885 domain-containing protein [Halioxenophilus sp. WMMB6]|uniref:DUF885 domain-containing protein n=1 Tax=Halioxenophilus sp. WMMB6 TaxID=3073815 RepID=UPI00295F1A26|nr:DUF885 domain-containing protein [Halioxenophilus sp. WMMB6]